MRPTLNLRPRARHTESLRSCETEPELVLFVEDFVRQPRPQHLDAGRPVGCGPFLLGQRNAEGRCVILLNPQEYQWEVMRPLLPINDP